MRESPPTRNATPERVCCPGATLEFLPRTTFRRNQYSLSFVVKSCPSGQGPVLAVQAAISALCGAFFRKVSASAALPGRRTPPLSTSGIKPVALVFSIDEVKNSRSPNCSGSCGRDGPKQDMTGCRYQLDARFQHSACNEGAKPPRRMVSGQVAFGWVSDDGVDDGVVVPHI